MGHLVLKGRRTQCIVKLLMVSFVVRSTIEDDADWTIINEMFADSSKRVPAEEGCVSWMYALSEDKKSVCTRETYKDVAAFEAHMKNVADLMEKVPSAGIKIAHCAVFVKADDLEEIKKALGPFTELSTFYLEN